MSDSLIFRDDIERAGWFAAFAATLASLNADQTAHSCQEVSEAWADDAVRASRNRTPEPRDAGEPGQFCIECGFTQPENCSSECLACKDTTCHNPECRVDAPLAHGFTKIPLYPPAWSARDVERPLHADQVSDD